MAHRSDSEISTSKDLIEKSDVDPPWDMYDAQTRAAVQRHLSRTSPERPPKYPSGYRFGFGTSYGLHEPHAAQGWQDNPAYVLTERDRLPAPGEGLVTDPMRPTERHAERMHSLATGMWERGEAMPSPRDYANPISQSFRTPLTARGPRAGQTLAPDYKMGRAPVPESWTSGPAQQQFEFMTGTPFSGDQIHKKEVAAMFPMQPDERATIHRQDFGRDLQEVRRYGQTEYKNDEHAGDTVMVPPNNTGFQPNYALRGNPWYRVQRQHSRPNQSSARPEAIPSRFGDPRDPLIRLPDHRRGNSLHEQPLRVASYIEERGLADGMDDRYDSEIRGADDRDPETIATASTPIGGLREDKSVRDRGYGLTQTPQQVIAHGDVDVKGAHPDSSTPHSLRGAVPESQQTHVQSTVGLRGIANGTPSIAHTLRGAVPIPQQSAGTSVATPGMGLSSATQSSDKVLMRGTRATPLDPRTQTVADSGPTPIGSEGHTRMLKMTGADPVATSTQIAEPAVASGQIPVSKPTSYRRDAQQVSYTSGVDSRNPQRMQSGGDTRPVGNVGSTPQTYRTPSVTTGPIGSGPLRDPKQTRTTARVSSSTYSHGSGVSPVQQLRGADTGTSGRAVPNVGSDPFTPYTSGYQGTERVGPTPLTPSTGVHGRGLEPDTLHNSVNPSSQLRGLVDTQDTRPMDARAGSKEYGPIPHGHVSQGGIRSSSRPASNARSVSTPQTFGAPAALVPGVDMRIQDILAMTQRSASSAHSVTPIASAHVEQPGMRSTSSLPMNPRAQSGQLTSIAGPANGVPSACYTLQESDSERERKMRQTDQYVSVGRMEPPAGSRDVGRESLESTPKKQVVLPQSMRKDDHLDISVAPHDGVSDLLSKRLETESIPQRLDSVHPEIQGLLLEDSEEKPMGTHEM